MELVNKPTQVRALKTQEKLLSALEALLYEKFFEQITIRDIAKKADVSSGTIYRRFKNKEAMLPVLYQRYDEKLSRWGQGFWQGVDLGEMPTLELRVNFCVNKHIEFYQSNKPILRTLYLYDRLHGELTVPGVQAKRESIYSQLLMPILEKLPVFEKPVDISLKVRFFIQLLLSSIGEKVLFDEQKPSVLLQLETGQFAQELSTSLSAYLYRS